MREIETKAPKSSAGVVNGRRLRTHSLVNCPAVMDDPKRKPYPQHWEEFPA